MTMAKRRKNRALSMRRLRLEYPLYLMLLLPALVICFIMFAFNFVGDGLRDAVDPKSTER